MKLIHAADIHLGRRRLEGRLPDEDFARAFEFIADQAITEAATVLLIAGDLFDRSQVSPPHLRQAQKILAKLKKAGIRVIAIEGNHDKAFIHSEDPTWLHYLAEDELLILLRMPFDANGPILPPWDAKSKSGAWIDIDGIRFVGAGYLGAATPHKVREIAARLESEKSHVLLLHAGPDYFVGEGGGFSTDDLRALNEKICYLALGHIHKPMRHGDWACNPGSPENCELHELGYDQDRQGQPIPRGYAVVELDAARRDKPVSIEIRTNPRRPCHRLSLDCTPFGNKLKDGVAALVKAATKLIQEVKPSTEAVIDLRLCGNLNLNRIALDQSAASAEIEKAAAVFSVSFDTSGLNVDGVAGAGASEGETMSRETLEKKAIRHLVDQENLWGIQEQAPDVATLFFELKECVRKGQGADQLAELLSQSPLVEKIRQSRAAAQDIVPAPPVTATMEEL